MARSKTKIQRPTSRTAAQDIHGFSRNIGLLNHISEAAYRITPSRDSSIDGEVHIFCGDGADSHKDEAEVLKGIVEPWQMGLVQNRGNESLFLQTKRGPMWMLRPRNGLKSSVKKATPTQDQHYGITASSPYAVMRDRVGSLWQSLKDAQGIKHLGLFFHNCSDAEIHGALTGFEIGSYRFTTLSRSRPLHPHFKVTAFGVSKKQITAAKAVGESVNLARHLVNLDAAKINPETYAHFMEAWFRGSKTMSVEIWDEARILKEGMHLHYGVGQGAVAKSHMVHLKYRPKGKSRLSKPLAFVGKGVTFDTGGLDIKPASGMRMMKKDMGGSASVVGIAHWLVESECDVACDLYLALAENSVDAMSFRPGDVLTARNGLTVEIHNTDAEGRLVMADVMDVATNKTPDHAPLALIDLSTLTGAMRVAVGTEIAGMFATHDGLADLALASGAIAGDPAWRLPLWENYRLQLRSSFADMSNASDSGFAGAITAALFLQRFVKGNIPWLHFDLYCWTDRVAGALGDVGGNGQGIQLMIELLQNVTPKTFSS